MSGSGPTTVGCLVLFHCVFIIHGLRTRFTKRRKRDKKTCEKTEKTTPFGYRRRRRCCCPFTRLYDMFAFLHRQHLLHHMCSATKLHTCCRRRRHSTSCCCCCCCCCGCCCGVPRVVTPSFLQFLLHSYIARTSFRTLHLHHHQHSRQQ